MDQGIICDMRCEWAWLPIWRWCIKDCICKCKGVNHAKYTYWAKKENIDEYGNHPDRVI